MYNLILSVIVIGIILPKTAGQCTLPFTDGTWFSSTRGTWTVSDSGTKIQNFDADLSTTLSTATLDCISRNGNKYVLGTQFELFFMVNIDVYICLDIQTTSRSPNSYVYYIVTPTDSSTGEKFTSDLANACSNSNYATPINTHIVLKSGSEIDAGITLPNAILGNYSLEYVEVDGVTVPDSRMDSCSDKTIMNFDNADSNNKLAFTSGDIVYGIYHVTSGSTVYLHTYNNDSSVDNVNTFSIACWVIASSGSQVKATSYPRECIQGQSSSSVPYGGQKFVFTPYYTCAPTTTESESTGLEGWQIALIVLGILALIFIIVIIVLCFLYARKSRHIRDEKEGFVDKERQPSPDSLHGEDIKRGTEKYNDKLDEITWEKRKNKEKERTFFLKEINKRGKKLQDMNTVVAEDKLKEDKIKDDKIKDEQPKVDKNTKPVPPKVQEKSTPRPQPPKQQQKPTPQPQPPPPQPAKKPVPEPIEIPPGKKSIPPTTPRPDAADTALLRIKKERERKERERDEKKRKEQAKEKKEHTMKKEDDKKVDEVIESKVIKKDRRSSSSEEYETDEEDKKERIQKLMEKRKRLEGTGWSPTGAQEGRLVGKKKRRKRYDGEAADDLTKTAMTTREEQEMLANRRRNRKKNFKRMAKKKLRSSDVETTDTEGEGGVSRKRSKRRKVGGSHGVEAPYTKVYHEKKGIEQELDDMDFWHTKQVPTVISDDDESDSPDRIKKEKLHVAPVKQPITETKEETSNVDRLMREEEEKFGKFGMKGLVIGMDGALPDGFHFDDEGNIIRDVDGKKLPKEAYERIMENRKKFGHVFSIPRLVRDSDGRPVGGYKNDEFGPYEEWDYGELTSAKEEEEEQKRAESQRPVSGRQVAFNTDDGLSVPATPLTESNYNQMKGRQLGSAERLRLSERLFEAKQKQEPDVPVFFANITKGGVKSEPVYIDAKQLVRQDCNKPPVHRSNVGNRHSSMIKRSDTFDDGRMKLRRNSKLRSSWSGREATIPDFIPEENETDSRQAKGIQGMTRSTHNIGSVDEFVLVGGSMQKLDKTQAHADSKGSSKWCNRYERHAHQPIREPSNLTDVSMRTAPDSVRPYSGDDRRLRKLMPEFVPDQKYFQHYLDTEKLPTNAALETRGLASHGREYLIERAEYWQEHEPYNQAPPPSELGLRLSRMRTFHTTADSGMHSMMSSAAGRPHSADNAQEHTHRSWNEPSRETTMTNVQMSERSHTNNELILPNLSAENTSRPPPTGRSDAAKTPSKMERTREKSVTINETPMEDTEKGSRTKKSKQAEQKTMLNNMLSITDEVE